MLLSDVLAPWRCILSRGCGRGLSAEGRLAAVQAVDPAQQMALEGELSRRHRVRDNLPGTPQFCPMVRWTPALREQAQRNLSGEARASHVVGGGAGRRERHNASPDARPVVWLHRHGHVRPGAVRGEEGFPTGRCAVNRCFIRVYRYRAGRLQHSLGPEWIHVPPGVGHTPVLRQQADYRRAAITGGLRLPERCDHQEVPIEKVSVGKVSVGKVSVV